MELKVWVDGLPRVVCGVTSDTTCRDLVTVLAAATGRTGRFALLERWRDSEHRLAPSAHPLAALLKWGEHASDVRFVLRHWDSAPQRKHNNSSNNNKTAGAFSPQFERRFRFRSGKNARIKKSLTFSGAHSASVHAPLDDSSLDSLDEHSSVTNSSDLSPDGFAANRYRTTGAIDDGYVSPPIAVDDLCRGDPTLAQDDDKRSLSSLSFASSSGDPTTYDLTTEADLQKVIDLQTERIRMQQSQMNALDSEISFWESREEDFASQQEALSSKLQELQESEKRLTEAIAHLAGPSPEDEEHMFLQKKINEARRSMERVDADLAAQRTRLHTLLEEIASTRLPSGSELAELSDLQRRLNEELETHQHTTTGLVTAEQQLCSAGATIYERRSRITELELMLTQSNRDDFATNELPTSTYDWKRGCGEGSSFSRGAGSKNASDRKLTLPAQFLQQAFTDDSQGLWV